MSQFKFYEQIKIYEKLDTPEERKKKAREIYDTFVMRELLSNSGVYSDASAKQVQKLLLQQVWIVETLGKLLILWRIF